MKFLVSSAVIALLSFAACLYMPWWSIAVTAFVVSVLIYQKPWMAFLSGFIALFCLWSLLAFYISQQNEDVLAHKVSSIILKKDSPFGLILMTGVIGALVAGFAALTGSYLRRAAGALPPAQVKNSEPENGITLSGD